MYETVEQVMKRHHATFIKDCIRWVFDRFLRANREGEDAKMITEFELADILVAHNRFVPKDDDPFTRVNLSTLDCDIALEAIRAIRDTYWANGCDKALGRMIDMVEEIRMDINVTLMIRGGRE